MPYESIAKLAIWKSKPEAKSQYHGKVEWDDNTESVLFASRLETGELTGVIKGDTGTYVFTVERTESENPNSPYAKGGCFANDTGERLFEVALWKSRSTNPKAPLFNGKIQRKHDQES